MACRGVTGKASRGEMATSQSVAGVRSARVASLVRSTHVREAH